MTEQVFREDAYARECEAHVVSVDEMTVELDRTVFYPLGGGQPGDTGSLIFDDGVELRILDTRNGPESGQILHTTEHAVPSGPCRPTGDGPNRLGAQTPADAGSYHAASVV